MYKYRYSFFMGFEKAIEYRMDFVLSLISAIFPIVIQVSLWTAIFQATGSGLMYGYTYNQMMVYTFMVGIIAKFFATGFEYEINEDIKNGGLNKYLIKPINYYIYRISCFLGGRVSTSLVFAIILTLLFSVFSVIGFLNISIYCILYFISSVILAMFLNFSIYFCVGMLAFWMSEISRLFPAIGIVLMVFCGGIFPLDILGDGFGKIILFLPFKYMIQFPVDIITGKMSNEVIILGLCVQVFWNIIMMIVANCLWKKGMKKYVAVGG